MSQTVDDLADTTPILERIWSELGGISKSLRAVELHLDQQDVKISENRGAVNLAGNIAARALEQSEATHVIMLRIDQSLTGIYELAKSGFDIATAIKSVQDTEPPSAPDNDPVVEIVDGTYRKFSIVSTGN